MRVPVITGVVVMMLLVGACDPAGFAPADDGIRYRFTNECGETILVGEFVESPRPVTLEQGQTGTWQTLDEEAVSEFVVTAVDDGVSRTIAPGQATFVIRAELCP